jgi:NlpC/P60 family/Transglycosylase SLT domain
MKKALILVPTFAVLFMGGTAVGETSGVDSVISRGLSQPAPPGTPTATGGYASTGTGQTIGSVPTPMLSLYARAATICPGLPWPVLAAIGTVESANGTSSLPGVASGSNPAGAEGPMQFEPATFARYAYPVPAGGVSPPSPYDPVDAVYAAARMLCADGAASPSSLGGAIYDYNHSSAYVADVLATAVSYGLGTGVTGGRGAIAVAYALSQVGTPYVWGGEAAGVGFDCSGLAQAAWATAGVRLPRVAQDQFDAGPAVPPGSPLAPGDLVFFGPSPGVATHVGLIVDPSGLMVDAPHSGALVRLDPFPTMLGAGWGSDIVVGVVRPG